MTRVVKKSGKASAGAAPEKSEPSRAQVRGTDQSKRQRSAVPKEIRAYNAAQSPGDRRICDALARVGNDNGDFLPRGQRSLTSIGGGLRATLAGFGIETTLAVPLATLALATLPPELRAEGSSIHNLLRTMAASAGIAAVQALTVFNGQRMHESLAGHVRLDDPVLRAALPPALYPNTAEAAMRLNEEITRQAAMVAYVDDFLAMITLTLCAVPMLLLLRQPRART